MRKLLGSALFLVLAACSQSSTDSQPAQATPQPQPSVQSDTAVVRGTAIIEVKASDTAPMDIQALDNTASATVTYFNAPAVTFQVDPSALVAGAMTGDTLSLGSVKVTALRDNNLNLCGTGGNQKCTTAEIRVYTTGTVAGFVHTTDNYGVPVYASGLNPTTAVPLGKPGVTVQQYANIPASKRVLRLTDFPNPTYNVTSDFTDAGSGTYKMTFVVEYALK